MIGNLKKLIITIVYQLKIKEKVQLNNVLINV